jgi:hypothetical protein
LSELGFLGLQDDRIRVKKIIKSFNPKNPNSDKSTQNTEPMTHNFEHQLAQMLPIIREETPKQTVRLQSVTKIALGFALGMLAMYCYMLPSDSPQRVERQERFVLTFDDTKLQEVRQPVDIFRFVVRVPIPQPEYDDQTQWQHGTLRNNLMQL